ncbi:hypothetical protein GCM10027429_00120 [Marivirga atlantica]|jgi:heme/copper-type cytochrome/quinol oxidase subunit 2|uniref:Adenylosuccinate synthetase n=1 Tax=Marivirga atlantica TaxID=1548457 RepID=A0A937DCW6_9BACT|nr:hypothetical protein [Marivirga atlantica]MBL0763622.1 hypothetical protein [Marivirga atlantica]
MIYSLVQIPQGVPNPADSEPLLINSTFDIILYIVLPILILIGYFLWRKRQKKRNEDKN